MKENNMQKISHLLSVVFKAGCIIMLALIILLALGTLITLCTSFAAPERFHTLLNSLAQTAPFLNFSQYILFLICCIGIFVCIFFVLYNASKIFSCIGKGISPFTKDTSSRIRKIAVWIIFYGIFSLLSVFKITFASFLLCCLFTLILFCISLIFDYGCTLQQEIDETL